MSMARIRLAERGDVAGIFEIYDWEVLHEAHTFETEVKSEAEKWAWFEAHVADRHPCVVAELEGRVVGWAGLWPWSPRAAYARTAENAVYVARGAEGKGLGRRLMEGLIERTRRATGVRVLIARIAQPNEASNRLHERLGFSEVGVMRRCGEKFGKLRDVRLMELHLDAG